MDSIETEEYEKWIEKEEELSLTKLNKLAKRINKDLFVTCVNDKFTLCLSDASEDNPVIQYIGDYSKIEGFLEGYSYAKNALPLWLLPEHSNNKNPSEHIGSQRGTGGNTADKFNGLLVEHSVPSNGS